MEYGEPVTILDSSITERSRKQLELYLHTHGFFDAEVLAETQKVWHNKKMKKVKYTITPYEPSLVNSIIYTTGDSALDRITMAVQLTSKIFSGSLFTENAMADERIRLAKIMQNNGYYEFRKEFVYFNVDTAGHKNKVDIEVIVTNPKIRSDFVGQKDTLISSRHQTYKVNKILVRPGGYVFERDSNVFISQGLYATQLDMIGVDANVLKKAIFIQPGRLYDRSTVEYTYGRLAALRVFKNIAISFDQTPGKPNHIDAFIDLKPSKKQSFSVELEGTNRNRNLGIYGALTYQNKNLFKGAEKFEFSISGGLEDQQIQNVVSIPNQIFNTKEIGADVSFFTPNLLFIGGRVKNPRYSEPYTRLSPSFRIQFRPDYSMRTAKFTYTYAWRTSLKVGWQLSPIDLGMVWIDPTPQFQETILSSDNPDLINAYSNHLISATRLTYIFDTRALRKRSNSNFFRASIEASGNSLRGLFAATNQSSDSAGSYSITGIRFAQYVRGDVDYRIYNVISESSEMVYRFFAGVGLPYGNLNVLPFEKSYFAGGSTGLRAWATRSLGPGASMDTILNIDQVGNIQLEANAEYRFKFTSLVEGALFADAGNIWLFESDNDRPQGGFTSEFYRQIALGGGLGLRLDFDFFIVRFDLGAKIHDPSRLPGERWFYQKKTRTDQILVSKGVDPGSKFLREFHFNFGINYPF